MKLCKDCKHFIEVVPNVSANCARMWEMDYVYGVKRFRKCEDVRSLLECGPEGNGWEPKEGQ